MPTQQPQEEPEFLRNIEINMFSKLDLDVEKYDGVTFYRQPDGEYVFNILKFTDENNEFENTDLGFKFIMLLTNENARFEVSEAILGDPVKNVLNFVKARCDGLILKKCESGLRIAANVWKEAETNRVNRLVKALAEAKKATA